MNEKKFFTIDFDVTMSGRTQIMAENREEAERKFRERIKDNPYEYARKVEYFVNYDITDINEEEE